MIYLITIFFMFFISTDALVIDRASNLCGRNITLVGAHVSIRVNFDQPFKLEDGVPCVAFIKYEPENPYDHSLKGMKLLPYITKTGSNTNPVDPKHAVLRIIVINDKLIRLDIFESRPFYLTVTPVVSIDYEGKCPNEFFKTCSSGVCLHRHLFCDGTAQCQTDESQCYTIPSENFLIFSFLTVVLVFLGISLGLAVYLYCKFYRNRTYLLSADYKPQYYGTVNGSLGSRKSFLSSTYASSNDVQSAGDNVQTKNDPLSYFNDIQPAYYPIRK